MNIYYLKRIREKYEIKFVPKTNNSHNEIKPTYFNKTNYVLVAIDHKNHRLKKYNHIADFIYNYFIDERSYMFANNYLNRKDDLVKKKQQKEEYKKFMVENYDNYGNNIAKN